MPFIGASTDSRSGFHTLMEKHSRASTPVSSTSSFKRAATGTSTAELSSADDDTQSLASFSRLPTTSDIIEQPEPINQLRKSSTISTISSISSSSNGSIFTDSDIRELLRFPNSSTHAYSYNPLSPYSLSVRLTILKRSIEIMINNPSLLSDSDEPHTFVNIDEAKKLIPQKSQLQTPVPPKVLRNASSAALSAFFTNKNQDLSPVKTLVSLNSKNSASSNQLDNQQKGLPTSVNIIRSSSNPLATTWEIGSGQTSENTSASSSRRNSLVSNLQSSLNDHLTSKVPSYYGDTATVDYEEKKKSDLEALLDLLNKALQNNTDDAASSLHEMSLFNINKLAIPSPPNNGNGSGKYVDNGATTKHDINYDAHDTAIKKQLLESLAQPFHEIYNTREALMDEKDLECKVEEYSRDPNSLITGNRILHTFTSQKNSSPKAIFTCSQQHPWKFRAANDLACLIFGISMNAMRALTLLDLIHSDSRNFVLNKIMTTEGQEQVFTGEIVGIKQPGHASSGLIWSSIWAKRKNGLIVCVFEKVPCDYMDVLLNLEDYSIENVVGGEGLQYGTKKFSMKEPQEVDSTGKKSVKFEHQLPDVESISKSLWQVVKDVTSGKLMGPDDDLLPMPLRVANTINNIRYYTLNYLEYNIPCAVSCSILDTELKLKIHSLPYQTGVFILNLHTYEMVSFNKSISKNMFGLHYAELVGKSIEEVIPSFPSMLAYIKRNYPQWDISLPTNKGLVLTEHFFRKIDCEMRGKGEEFYHSIGLNALHRDGSFIKVDVQLRVISWNYMVLWITYSRDLFGKNYSSNPSQLKILNENNINVVTSASSEGSSKTNSEKISVTDFKQMHDDLEKMNLSLEGSTVGSHLEKKPMEEKKEENKEVEETEEVPDDDLELKAKLEVAKRFHQDKSQFVKDDNFKLDKELIVNITSASPPAQDDQYNMDSAASDSSIQTSNASKPYVIGSQKHTKKFSDFLVLQKMGEGAYGKVDLCMHKKDKYIVVIKRIYKERILVDTWVRDRTLGTIPSEIQIMVTLNRKPHENILRILDFFEDDDYYYLETEMHGETGSIDLFDLIELKTNMTEFEAKLLFKQVASGIKHLHDNGIVHRDIKDENVIVDNKGFVKLIDFGSAAYVKSGPFDVFVGTIDYAAPEVLGGEPYEGKPQDIWAIGVLLYTIIYKENPFYNIDEILDGDLRIQSTHEVSAECVALIRKILNRSVSKRPTIDDIMEDSWLQL
ncbi:Psk1/Psk2 [Kluyveromyces lactis]|nr:Psk1/Psk2 [Kluyveromyces lactis]